MTADEFTAALRSIGWAQHRLAKLLECDPVIVQRWGRGVAAIPPSIAAWLAGMAQYHERKPTPTDWRVR